MVFPWFSHGFPIKKMEAESDHFALNAALEQRKPEIANCRKQAGVPVELGRNKLEPVLQCIYII